MNQIKLKRCPFCGGYAILGVLKRSAGNRYKVFCTNKECTASDCSCFGKFFYTETDAANAWNRRVNNV